MRPPPSFLVLCVIRTNLAVCKFQGKTQAQKFLRVLIVSSSRYLLSTVPYSSNATFPTCHLCCVCDALTSPPPSCLPTCKHTKFSLISQTIHAIARLYSCCGIMGTQLERSSCYTPERVSPSSLTQVPSTGTP